MLVQQELTIGSVKSTTYNGVGIKQKELNAQGSKYAQAANGDIQLNAMLAAETNTEAARAKFMEKAAAADETTQMDFDSALNNLFKTDRI